MKKLNLKKFQVAKLNRSQKFEIWGGVGDDGTDTNGGNEEIADCWFLSFWKKEDE